MFSKKDSPYLFIAPFLIMFLVFWIWPILQSFAWSLHKWDGITKAQFVLFQNYLALFKDPVFLVSLKNMLLAALVYIVLLLIFAIMLGFLMNSPLLLGRAYFRSAFFIPVTVSLPVVALIFMIIYAHHNGILNKILLPLGIPEEINWLGDRRTALWAIVALRLWRALGYYSIFVVAGLQAIPKETIEASQIDGANNLQTAVRVILPQLKPILIYITIASSVWAFQLFEEPWILTEGGPVNATSTVGIHIYQNAFKFFKLGYASASAYVLAVIILVFAISQLRISRER